MALQYANMFLEVKPFSEPPGFSRLFTEQRNPANVHGTAHKVRQHAASYLTCTGYPQLWKT